MRRPHSLPAKGDGSPNKEQGGRGGEKSTRRGLQKVPLMWLSDGLERQETSPHSDTAPHVTHMRCEPSLGLSPVLKMRRGTR